MTIVCFIYDIVLYVYIYRERERERKKREMYCCYV